MKYITLLLFFLIIACTPSKDLVKTAAKTPEEEIKAFQAHLTKEFKNPETSPLREKAKHFKKHDFFAIDLDYRVEAEFEPTPEAQVFTMPTSGPRKPKYKKFGILKFELKGKPYTLALYQNQAFLNNPMYKDYLFLPFNDLTNGVETYGGGRYIDFKIPTSNKVILDFNKCYNPYCAYSDGWSCPIPPVENNLDMEVRAGIKLEQKD